MLIAQISDLHLPPRGGLAFGHVDTAAALARIVADVNAQVPRPDLALISGDLTNDGTRQEALHARGILEGLACPWLVLPGNHDRRAVLRRVFGAERLPAEAGAGGFLCYRRALDGLDLIGLDSVDEGAPGGAFCAERAAWLGRALAAGAGRAKLLFLHHPPVALGPPETDHDGFRGAGELARMLAGADGLLAVAAGHVHLATATRWQGRTLVTAPSVGMELTRDFGPDPPPSRFRRSAPGYLLHFLHPAGHLVSHAVTLPQSPRSYPFAPLSGAGAGLETDLETGG